MAAKGDRSLIWDADIDLSKFRLSAKNIEKIMKQLGQGVDTSGINTAFEETAKRAKSTQQEVVAEVQKAQKQMNLSLVQEAQKAKKTIKGEGVTTLLPDGFVQSEKKKVEQVVDFTKQELKELQAAVDQYGISALQTRGKSIERPVKGPSSNLNAILSESMQQTLSTAKTAFSALDEETKQYVLDLVDMQAALTNAESAQKRLSAAFAAGKIDQKEYTQATAALKKAQEEIQAEIKNQTTVQETSLNLQNLQTNTLKEKKNALTALKTAYSNLTEAELADEAIGGKMRTQMADLTAKINEQSAVSKKATSILTEYRNLRNKIANDSIAGIVNQEDIQRAAKMELAIDGVNKKMQVLGSSTASAEILSEGFRGLSGVIGIASGAMSIFGDDSEETQKLVQSLTAAMFAMYNIQSLVQILNKNSKTNIAIRELLLKTKSTNADTAAMTANTVATEANTVSEGVNATAKVAEAGATETAAKSQWSLNTALAANPIGWVMTAVTALTGAILLFSDGTDKAVKAQKKLNDELERYYNLVNDLADLNKIGDDAAIAAAQRKLDFLKAEGAENEKIIAQQKEVNELTKQGAQNKLNTLLQLPEGAVLSDEQYGEAVKNYTEAAEKALKKASGEHLKKRSGFGMEWQNTLRVLGISEETDEEARVYLDKKAQEEDDRTKERTKSRLAAISSAYQDYLNAQSKGEIDLLNARKKDHEKAAKSDSEDALKRKVQEVQDQKSIIDAKLNFVTAGSAEELNIKIQSLEKQKQIEILNAKDNAATIQKINADSQKKQDDLKKQYAQDEISRVLQLQKDFAKEQLANLNPNSDSFLAYTKQLQNLTGQEQTEKALADAAKKNPSLSPDLVKDALTINGENYEAYAKKVENIDQDLAQRIRAVWAETNNKNLQSDNQFVDKQYQNAAKLIELQGDLAKAKNNAILNNPNASKIQVDKANIGINQIDIDTQEKLIGKFIEKYDNAEGAISRFVEDVEKDFDKLKDLHLDDKEINKYLDSFKDPSVRQALEQLITKLKGLKDAQSSLKKLSVQDIFGEIADLGNALSSAGQAISGINEGLGDTLETMGQLVSTAASLGESIASGNPVGIVTSVFNTIGSIFSLGAKARESARKAQQELIEAQDKINIGQLQYNQYLRDQMDIQDGIVRGTFAELDAQKALTEEKLRQSKGDREDAKRWLLTNGKEITGRHKEKYGGFLGIGKKTRVVDEFGDLGINGSMTDQQIADYLKMLELEGKLDERTKKRADEFISLNEEAKKYGETLEQINEQIAESFAGTTADSIAQSIIDGLKAGKRSFEDFSQDINQILSNSIFASIKDSLISGPVKKIMDQFLDDFNQNDGGMITPDQIAVLQEQLKNAIAYGTEAYDAAMKAFPDLNNAANASSTLTGQIKGITQDQASELGGLFRLNIDIDKRLLSQVQQSNQYLVQNINHLKNIEKNTRDTADNLTITNKKLDQVINNTKTQSNRDLNQL